MNPSDFRVVYDVTRDGWSVFRFPSGGLVFVLVGIALPYLMRRGILQSPAWMRSWFPKVWLGFAVLCTLAAFVGVGSEFWSDYTALSTGHASYVEGPVENFVPMPVTGHAQERFDVKGVPFSYSDYVITPGFSNTTSHGGPIREGLHVRIGYSGNDILKLEIPRSTQ